MSGGRKLGVDQYCCATCGMFMKEPCEHWRAINSTGRAEAALRAETPTPLSEAIERLAQMWERERPAAISRSFVRELREIAGQGGRAETLAPRETRTLEEVLQLHVSSSESMRETYRRTANSDMENFQEGFTDGLKQAIEVYGNWRRAAGEPEQAK